MKQEWTHCRSPLCGKKLRSDNLSGFCGNCIRYYPGKRWFLRTRKDFKRRHELHLATDRKYKVALREKKLCVRCRAPAPDTVCCAPCREKNRVRQERRRDQRKQANEARRAAA